MIYPLASQHISDVAAIHHQVLPHSIIPRLGNAFMEQFFYGKLTENQLFGCNVFVWNNKLAGFVSFSADSKKLFRKEIQKHFFLLTRVMLKTLIEKPQTFPAVVDAFSFLFLQHSEFGHQIPTEVLTLAILPEFRTLDFYKKHRIKVGEELFASMIHSLQEQGIKEVKLFTETIKKNVLAKLFYTSFGMKLEGCRKERGLEMELYTGQISHMVSALEKKRS